MSSTNSTGVSAGDMTNPAAQSPADTEEDGRRRGELPEHVENAELVPPGPNHAAPAEQDGPTEMVSEPAKVMRIG